MNDHFNIGYVDPNYLQNTNGGGRRTEFLYYPFFVCFLVLELWNISTILPLVALILSLYTWINKHLSKEVTLTQFVTRGKPSKTKKTKGISICVSMTIKDHHIWLLSKREQILPKIRKLTSKQVSRHNWPSAIGVIEQNWQVSLIRDIDVMIVIYVSGLIKYIISI